MSEAQTDHEQQVLDFFEAFGAGGDSMHAAFRQHFSEDCEWSNPGAPTTRGPEEAIELMRGYEAALGWAGARIDTHHIVSRGDVVMAERLDTALAADGSEIVAVMITGVFEFEGDRIAKWREYFDPTPAQAVGHA
jgi:limonene-1,2-epoxide hydrolase